MRNLPHIISKVFNEPWVITPEKHASIRQALESAGTGNSYHSFDGKVHGVEAEDYDYPEPKRFQETYVIPIYGVIGKHLSGMELSCGGCSLDAVNMMLRVALNDNTITKVILDFDTPGGTVTGVPETAKLISELAEEKEVIAYTETLCASGGYWLASQAPKFFCTESAQVGSVGVYALYQDQTKALEMEGIKMNPISAGEFKLSGAYFKQMTETERAMFQARVDDIYKRFKSAVVVHRQIPDEFLQGQVFYGDQAAENGLVDGVVDDIEELI